MLLSPQGQTVWVPPRLPGEASGDGGRKAGVGRLVDLVPPRVTSEKTVDDWKGVILQVRVIFREVLSGRLGELGILGRIWEEERGEGGHHVDAKPSSASVIHRTTF